MEEERKCVGSMLGNVSCLLVKHPANILLLLFQMKKEKERGSRGKVGFCVKQLRSCMIEMQ